MDKSNKIKSWLLNHPLDLRQIHNAVYMGRNEPCSCGSEKKYKKCCLSKVNRELTGITQESIKAQKKEFRYYDKKYKKIDKDN
jgi:hypothetical protein